MRKYQARFGEGRLETRHVDSCRRAGRLLYPSSLKFCHAFALLIDRLGIDFEKIQTDNLF